ncbi:MAG: FAD-dependent oxidoreductase, partial [Dehalococcoidia bacterium]
MQQQGGTTNGKHALIVGCGIAGPVLAMYLRRAGITSAVYEGWPEPRDEVGAFMGLAPNGIDVLNTLGVKDAALAGGLPTTRILFQNHRGKVLGHNPETIVTIRRGVLTRALREAAIERGISVQFGKRLAELEVTPGQRVVARFEDGTEARGDLLLGCDGIHSCTRRIILPDAPAPAYTGVIDNGAVTPNATLPPSGGVMRMMFGLRGFFGYQVAPSGEIYWFENFQQAEEPDREALDAVPHGEWRQKLLALHRGDHAPIAEIIRVTESPIGRFPIYDMPSLPTWHKGPI